jgi:hypothetical protein
LYGEPSSRFGLFTVDEKNGQLDTPNFFVAVLKYPENRDGLVPLGFGSTEYIKNMEMVVVVPWELVLCAYPIGITTKLHRF